MRRFAVGMQGIGFWLITDTDISPQNLIACSFLRCEIKKYTNLETIMLACVQMQMEK